MSQYNYKMVINFIALTLLITKRNYSHNVHYAHTNKHTEETSNYSFLLLLLTKFLIKIKCIIALCTMYNVKWPQDNIDLQFMVHLVIKNVPFIYFSFKLHIRTLSQTQTNQFILGWPHFMLIISWLLIFENVSADFLWKIRDLVKWFLFSCEAIFSIN